jgi:hypothetical protein
MCGYSRYGIDWLALGSSPYGPDAPRPYRWAVCAPNLISTQESPVPLPKFQMARRQNLNILWVQERNPDIRVYLNIAFGDPNKGALPPGRPHGVPLERDAPLEPFIIQSPQYMNPILIAGSPRV